MLATVEKMFLAENSELHVVANRPHQLEMTTKGLLRFATICGTVAF